MFENKISKGILEGSLGERRPAEKPRNRWEGEMLSEATRLFNREIWSTGRGSDGGREQVTSWPESGPKSCRKKKLERRKKGEKQEKKLHNEQLCNLRLSTSNILRY